METSTVLLAVIGLLFVVAIWHFRLKSLEISVKELRNTPPDMPTVTVPWPFAYGNGRTKIPVDRAVQLIIDSEGYEWYEASAIERVQKPNKG